MSKKKVCIADGKVVKKGHPVKEDSVIRFIRWAKKKLGTYKGNVLVVCDEHLEEYLEKRKQFEKNAMILGGIFGVLLFLYLLALVGNFSLSSLLSFLGLALLLTIMFLLLILISYVPAVEVRGKGKEASIKRVKKK